jgi:raffinose/stachyose/melibiose transport system permease protein
MTRHFGRTFAYVIVGVLVVVTMVPLVSLVLSALYPSGAAVQGIGWPDEPTLSNFAEAWVSAGMDKLLWNSVILAVIIVPLTLVIATLAGFGLACLNLRWNKAVLGFFVAGLTIPIELVIIPLYYNLQSMGLTNTFTGLVLVQTALFMPFSVFWMYTHFASLPKELIEAAQIDGARATTILRVVLLPLSGPAMTTLAVLVFMWCWKQFLLILILIQDSSKRTAPAGLGFFIGEFTINIPLLSAASVIVVLPILVLYIALQRYFVEGLTQGALKG